MNELRFQRKLDRIRLKGERQKAKVEVESKYAEYYPHREGAKVSNVMLAIVVFMIVAYVVASFVLQFFTSVEISATLTTCYFAFWTVEIVSLAGIRVSKVFKKDKDKDKGDVQ